MPRTADAALADTSLNENVAEDAFERDENGDGGEDDEEDDDDEDADATDEQESEERGANVAMTTTTTTTTESVEEVVRGKGPVMCPLPCTSFISVLFCFAPFTFALSKKSHA